MTVGTGTTCVSGIGVMQIGYGQIGVEDMRRIDWK